MRQDRAAASDEWLVERFRASGEQEYFAEIVHRYGKSVLARCHAVLQNLSEAEDATQDTFLAALSKINLYRGGNFASWLYTIARNLCLNRLKSGIAVHERVGLDDLGEAPASGTGETEYDLADELWTALKELSPPQRVALKLFYMDGYSYDEISKTVGLSLREVKTHLQNGRRRLRSVWEGMHKAKG